MKSSLNIPGVKGLFAKLCFPLSQSIELRRRNYFFQVIPNICQKAISPPNVFPKSGELPPGLQASKYFIGYIW